MYKVIKKLKKTVLLQDKETLYMFYVPADVFNEGDESKYQENSIPYSISFDLILDSLVDSRAIQQEFYKSGIHTFNDLLNNRRQVNNLLKKFLSADSIIRNVKGD